MQGLSKQLLESPQDSLLVTCPVALLSFFFSLSLNVGFFPRLWSAIGEKTPDLLAQLVAYSVTSIVFFCAAYLVSFGILFFYFGSVSG